MKDGGFGEGCISGLLVGFVVGIFALMFFLWLVTGWQPGDKCGAVAVGLKDGKAIATQTCSREMQ